MGVAAHVLSRRSAHRLTEPIEAVTHSAEELAAGRPTGDVPVVTDDELHRLTMAFNRMRAPLAERAADVEAFSYSVSHDLRAPLRTIEGFSRALLEDHGDRLGDEGRRFLGLVRENVATLTELLDALLILARLEHDELDAVPLDMGRVARSVFDELAPAASGRKLELHLAELPPAYGNPVMIRTLFTNLLSNAVKFTQPRDTGRIEIGSFVQDRDVVYYVRDNGVGFDPVHADNLFRVFRRLHPSDEFGGTGAGLAIVERIVRRHGGRVWAQGAIDRGASVYFVLSPKA